MPQTPKRPPRNACGRSDNDLRRCLFFVCPYRGRERYCFRPHSISTLCRGVPAPAEKWSGARILPGGPGSLPGAFDAPFGGDAARRRDFTRVIRMDDGRVGHPVRCTNPPRASRAIRFPKPDVPGAAPGRRAHFRETFRPAGCKPAVAKAAGRRRLERYQRFPPVHGSVAQSPERPVVCGTVAGASPVGSASSHRGIAAQGRRVPHPQTSACSDAAGGILPDGVKVARRPVKPRVLVRVQVRQPAFRSQGARDPARRPAKTEARGANPGGSTNV